MPEKATERPLRVLFLFNRARKKQAADFVAGKGHDNHFNGMFRIRTHGIETDFLEPEQFVSSRIASLWRHVLNIYWMQVPLFPLFFHYDIVFAGSAYGSMLLRALLGIRRPKWVIYDANIAGTIGTSKTLRQKLFRFAVSRCDGIVTLSQAECDTLRSMFPNLKEDIVFLHEGVDTEYFKPFNVPEGGYILSVGVDPGRDFKTLVEAVRGLPITLKIATKQERVAGIDLPPNVTAHLYPPDEMRDIYARARFVVVGLNMKAGSENDSMGTYAVIEAMASGKAVIATRTNALASYIRDGENGVFVPVRDISATRAAILDLWNDPAKRDRLGKAARAFALEYPNANVYARKLAAFFRQVAKRGQ